MNSQVRILGANIDQVRMDEAMKTIHEFVVSQQPHQVVTVNLDFLRIAQGMVIRGFDEERPNYDDEWTQLRRVFQPGLAPPSLAPLRNMSSNLVQV